MTLLNADLVSEIDFVMACVRSLNLEGLLDRSNAAAQLWITELPF